MNTSYKSQLQHGLPERKLVYAYEDEIARLKRIELAALVYFTSYCRDEAEEIECCVSPEQHDAARELRDALANKRSANTKTEG